jgi:cell division protein FtsN
VTMRDYRRGAPRRSRSGAGFSGWAGLAIGLAIGLAVAAGVWQYKSRPAAEPVAAKQKKREPASERDDSADKAPNPNSTGTTWDFPRMLPNTEVVIPEREKDVHHDVHAAPVTRPGTYYLQAGSYRNEADADRVRAKLALAGIESKVQKVSVDADTWHRVRIGPYTDLDALNRVRTRLRQADIDAILISVGGE